MFLALGLLGARMEVFPRGSSLHFFVIYVGFKRFWVVFVPSSFLLLVILVLGTCLFCSTVQYLVSMTFEKNTPSNEHFIVPMSTFPIYIFVL